MISENEKKQIEKLQCDEDLEACINVAATSRNTLFLQEYAISYNWDNGFALPNAIADNSCCDLGTALTLFWLSEAMWYYTGESQRHEFNNDWADFCEMITARLVDGFYQPGPVSYNPDINLVTKYKYEEMGVPKVLYEGVNGV